MTKMNRSIRLWCVPICIVIQLCVSGIAAQNDENCGIDPRCPRFDTGDSAFLVPHPDCGKFYTCARGKACEYNCPGDLHFNPRLLTCDYPEVAGCTVTTQRSNQPLGGSGGYPPIGDITSGGERKPDALQNSTFVGLENQKPVVNPEPIVRQETVDPNNGNRGQGTQQLVHEVLNPRPEFNGSPSSPVQPSDNPNFNNWDQGTQQIVHEVHHPRPEYNGSPSSPVQPSEESSRGPNQGYTTLESMGYSVGIDEFNGQASNSSRPGCVVDSRCSSSEALNSEKLLYLKHANCEKFYMCSGGEACEVDCPPGLHFNAQQSQCDYQEVACCDASKPCSRNNMEVPMSSCIPEARCPMYEDTMNPTHLPHPTNCDRFYKCSYGKACELPCPPGQHFSVAMNRCEFPNVACCDRSITCVGQYAAADRYLETRDESIKEAGPVKTDDAAVQVFQSLEEPTKAPIEPTPESIRINTCFEAQHCPDGDGKKNLLMRHSDCSKFFSCFEGTICEFVCPVGLHFNERSQVCDKPEKANCSQAFN